MKTIDFDESPFVLVSTHVFSAIGIAIRAISSRRIQGPATPVIDLTGKTLTQDQRYLFGITSKGATRTRGYALACFVEELPQQFVGFSNPEVCSCVVSRNCGPHALAHELGHLLGLGHESDPANLMYEFGPVEEMSPTLNSLQAAKAQGSPLLKVTMVTEEHRGRIELAAYYRWLERGSGHGMDLDDWLAAERALEAV